jgi:hypothetical protein
MAYKKTKINVFISIKMSDEDYDIVIEVIFF